MRPKKSPAQVRAARRRAGLTKHHGADKAADIMAKAKPPRRLDSATIGTLSSIGAYDELMGPPATWSDCKIREQVEAELIQNQTRRDEQAIARGKLFTREQVAELQDAEDDVIDSELARLPDAWSASVPPDMKMAVHKVARAWLTTFRSAVSDKLMELGTKIKTSEKAVDRG